MRKMFEVYDMDDSPIDKMKKKIISAIKKSPFVDLIIITDFGHGLLNNKIIEEIYKSKPSQQLTLKLIVQIGGIT